MKRTDLSKPNCRFYIITILITFCAGFALVLVTGTMLGSLDLSIPGAEPVSAVLIQVSPRGSEIFLDGSYLGLTPLSITIQSGKHTLCVEKERYTPYETDFIARPNEALIIEHKLAYQIFLEPISYNAKSPLWDQDGTLYYVNSSDGVIYSRLETGEKRQLLISPGNLTSLAYPPEGKFLLAVSTSGERPEQLLIGIQDSTVTALGIGATAPIWKSNSSQFFHLGWSTDLEKYEFWSSESGEPPQVMNLQEITNLFSVESISWSADGSWFLAQSDESLDIWLYDDDMFVYTKHIEPASGAIWSPIGTSLTFMRKNDGIYFLENPETSEPVMIFPYGQLPFRWMPDSKHLVFTTHNPAEGSSAFWSVDVETNTKTLLADSSMILGRVTDFAISPDGLQIAFVNDLDHLSILVLSESGGTP